MHRGRSLLHTEAVLLCSRGGVLERARLILWALEIGGARGRTGMGSGLRIRKCRSSGENECIAWELLYEAEGHRGVIEQILMLLGVRAGMSLEKLDRGP
jgi:hypothetical protein